MGKIAIGPRAPTSSEMMLVDCIRARRLAEIKARLFRDLLTADGHAPAHLDQIVANTMDALKTEARELT